MHEPSPIRSPRPTQRITLRWTAALLVLAFAVLGMTGACSDPAACEGGYVAADGTCEGKCTPEACGVANNTCLNNRCVLECTTHNVCLADGSQECAPAVEDDTGRAIMACQPHKQVEGYGSPCPFGTECNQFGTCADNGKRCDLNLATQCMGDPMSCKLDQATCGGAPDCKAGKCAETGEPCVVLPCAMDQCKVPIRCATSGEGDASAYCTKDDCSADADCGAGYYCGISRDPRELCGSTNPTKGNSGICGYSSDACVEPASLGQGNTMFEGQRCILRKTCLKRDACAPCDTDLDCSQIANSRCVKLEKDTQKRCATQCAVDKDCGPSYACKAIEGAADGAKACHHRFGSCVGGGKYCEPCVNDTDCGALTGSSVCYQTSDGAKACLDLKATFGPCMSDADCPLSPSGKHATCDLNMLSSSYQQCLPFPYVNDKASCW